MDILIFHQINQFAGRFLWLDSLAIFFAQYFEYLLIFFLFLFSLLNFKKYWLLVFQSFLAAVLARLVIVNIIRWFWSRPRPFIENQVNLLLEVKKTASFPSGHAAFYFAIATVVFLYLKKFSPRPRFWWGPGFGFFLASFFISLARVFVGIHWPSDILVGAIIGIFSGCFIFFLVSDFFQLERNNYRNNCDNYRI